MTIQTLSSSLTFIYKYVFIVFWSGGFGYGTLMLFLQGREDIPKYQFLAAWIFGTAFIYLATGRAKKVSFDGDKFYVSNYLKDLKKTLIDIKRVLKKNGILIVINSKKPINMLYQTQEVRFWKGAELKRLLGKLNFNTNLENKDNLYLIEAVK